MRRVGLVTLGLLFSISEASAATSAMGRVLEYGILVGETVPSGLKPDEHTHTVVGHPRVATTTDQIPAKVGTAFGMHFEIYGMSYANRNLLIVTISRTKPPVVGSDGKLSTGSSRVYRLPINLGRADGWVTQHFEKPSELVPGKYRFEVKLLGVTLAEKTFEVIAQKLPRPR